MSDLTCVAVTVIWMIAFFTGRFLRHDDRRFCANCYHRLPRARVVHGD